MNPKQRKFALIILLLVGIVLIFNFKHLFVKEKVLRLPAVVKSPDVNATIASGQVLHVELNEENLKSHDSIVIKYGQNKTETLTNKYVFDVPTTGVPLGNYTVQMTLFKNKKSSTVELPYIVVSDLTPEKMSYTVLKTMTHDFKSYVQGLEISDQFLYESSGQYGQSGIKKMNLSGSKVYKDIPLSREYFAEGLTILKDKIYLLTYKENTCFIFDKELNVIDKKSFNSSTSEGWGITNDGVSLIVSDGSHRLTYIDPVTFKTEKVLNVYAGSKAVQFLNELEYVDGIIYANIYTTNQIAKIDALTAKVLSVLDLSSLKNENPSGEVLNGIAYDKIKKTFLVTGKYWDKMYEIRMM